MKESFSLKPILDFISEKSEGHQLRSVVIYGSSQKQLKQDHNDIFLKDFNQASDIDLVGIFEEKISQNFAQNLIDELRIKFKKDIEIYSISSSFWNSPENIPNIKDFMTLINIFYHGQSLFGDTDQLKPNWLNEKDIPLKFHIGLLLKYKESEKLKKIDSLKDGLLLVSLSKLLDDFPKKDLGATKKDIIKSYQKNYSNSEINNLINIYFNYMGKPLNHAMTSPLLKQLEQYIKKNNNELSQSIKKSYEYLKNNIPPQLHEELEQIYEQ